MGDGEKRELRQLKRDIKRAGVKRARLQLKRGLVDDPEEAHEAGLDYGRHRSAGLNGVDRDATRKRAGRETVDESGSSPRHPAQSPADLDE